MHIDNLTRTAMMIDFSCHNSKIAAREFEKVTTESSAFA